MNNRIATLGLALGLLVSTSASALTIGYRPRTGDIWIDTHLTEINRYGRVDNDYFVNDVVSSFGAPRSNPDGIDVNVHCLDPSTITGLRVEPFDGQDWEANAAQLRHLTE